MFGPAKGINARFPSLPSGGGRKRDGEEEEEEEEARQFRRVLGGWKSRPGVAQNQQHLALGAQPALL